MLMNGRRFMIIVFIFLPNEYLFLRRRMMILFGFMYLTIRWYIVAPPSFVPRTVLISAARYETTAR